MQLTRIEDENRDYFTHLCPRRILKREEPLMLGVISDEGEAVSMCAIDVQGAMAELLWIYTDEEQREKGYAAFLAEEAYKLLNGMQLDGMEAHFLSSDEELDDFLAGRGFLVGRDTGLYSVPMEDLFYSSAMDRLLEERNADRKAVCLSETGAKQQRYKEMIMRLYGFEESALSGISPEYSIIVPGEGEDISGAILAVDRGNEDLYISYLAGDGSAECLKELICGLYDVLAIRNKTGGKLYFADREGKIVSFLETLFDEEREAWIEPDRMYAVRLFDKK